MKELILLVILVIFPFKGHHIFFWKRKWENENVPPPPPTAPAPPNQNKIQLILTIYELVQYNHNYDELVQYNHNNDELVEYNDKFEGCQFIQVLLI